MSMDAKRIKTGLDTLMRFGNKSECDLFIFRTCVELSMFDLNISKDLITIYQKEGKESPLINLFNFIVEAIKKKDFALFKLLVDKYKPSLDRDSNFMEALDSMSKPVSYTHLTLPTSDLV
eukprot:TRINITY_DN8733_c0_g1_i6.p2 TRINITY_DN8733_c0_g1~~TRINITY_DN8733_c0_g1_i6.p2  ORF type:complete len:120 (-),score=41.28 TRINITY_DN8733_c0_g1_i6:46-405(-)